MCYEQFKRGYFALDDKSTTGFEGGERNIFSFWLKTPK